MKKILLSFLMLFAAGAALEVWTHRAWGTGASQEVLYWYCPMHTSVHKDHAGKCPICSMDLVPKYKTEMAAVPKAAGQRKVKYWMDSMNPSFHSDHPGKAPDGMDLVPVYEEAVTADPTGVPENLKGLATVQLDAFKRQSIGVKVVAVRRSIITRLIRTVGRVAGGGGDFAALAGDFAAQQASHPSTRFVVADVYTLDQPFLKVGQKARVSSLSAPGTKAEGQVVQVYPYDGTLSRVRRVRLQVKGLFTEESYANVEIEAATSPRLSVPREAVLTTGTHDYVFVAEGEGRFKPREVTVGFLGDEDCEVIAGLKEGEKIAAGGNFLLDADSRLHAGTGE